MSFAMIQKLRYIFDGYFLVFTTSTSIYGLLVDIKQSKSKGTNRDAKIAKKIYISVIAISVMCYIVTKFL